MHIENMCQSMETLASAIQSQLSYGIENVCTSEMSEATDMLKDISEALYYANIVKSMEESSAEKVDSSRYYNDYRYTRPVIRRGYSMEYPEVYDPTNEYSKNQWRLNKNSYETPYERSKKGYSDGKMIHSEDKTSNMANLEEYLKNLSEDVTGLISQMDTAEKATVKNKLTALASRIV